MRRDEAFNYRLAVFKSTMQLSEEKPSFGDIHPRQWHRPPFDRLILARSFGLLRDDWQPKPTLNGLRSVDRTLVPHYPDPSWKNLDPDQYWRNPKEEIKRLYKRFRDRIAVPQR